MAGQDAVGMHADWGLISYVGKFGGGGACVEARLPDMQCRLVAGVDGQISSYKLQPPLTDQSIDICLNIYKTPVLVCNSN